MVSKRFSKYIKIFPDYKLYLWLDHPDSVGVRNENIIVKDVSQEKFVLSDFMEASTNFAQRTDIMRLEIVYKYGGIYVDIDSTALRSFGKGRRQLIYL